MKLAKAQLEDEAGKSIIFQFNPDSISFSKSAEWRTITTQAAAKGPVRQYAGAAPISLTLPLLFDDAEEAGTRVSDAVNLLSSWMNPSEKSLDKGTPAPAELIFSWGQFKIGDSGKFQCHLEKADVNYTMFRPNGVPVRAKVTVTLKSAKKDPARQNPTSGGIRPQRRHVLQRGDRLGVIAAREYGDAGYWRQIADFNGISDPFTLPIGRQILLPAVEELSRI
jgi:nucleoid-associated protein YgaU